MDTDAGSDAASPSSSADSDATATDATSAADELDASSHQRRARLAFDLGRRVLTGQEPIVAPPRSAGAMPPIVAPRRSAGAMPLVDAGAVAAVAVQLFRQSLYWSLRARTGARGVPTATQAFIEHAGELRVRLGPDATDALETLENFEFETFATYPVERLQALAATLERIAFDYIAERRSADNASPRESRARGWAALVVLGFGLVALTALSWGPSSKPNLAEGKPWSTSSVFADCDAKTKRCGGVATAVFFHTNEEDNPWFEYDLGAPLRFSSLTIRNRSDAVQERAVPLVVEISNDKKTYRELARQQRVFDVWEPSFPAVRARYLRLRVARRSFLHLNGVEIHP